MEKGRMHPIESLTYLHYYGILSTNPLHWMQPLRLVIFLKTIPIPTQKSSSQLARFEMQKCSTTQLATCNPIGCQRILASNQSDPTTGQFDLIVLELINTTHASQWGFQIQVLLGQTGPVGRTLDFLRGSPLCEKNPHSAAAERTVWYTCAYMRTQVGSTMDT